MPISAGIKKELEKDGIHDMTILKEFKVSYVILKSKDDYQEQGGAQQQSNSGLTRRLIKSIKKATSNTKVKQNEDGYLILIPGFIALLSSSSSSSSSSLVFSVSITKMHIYDDGFETGGDDSKFTIILGYFGDGSTINHEKLDSLPQYQITCTEKQDFVTDFLEEASRVLEAEEPDRFSRFEWRHRIILGTIWSNALFDEIETLRLMVEGKSVNEDDQDDHEEEDQTERPLIDPNTPDSQGCSPLHFAAAGGKITSMLCLLNNLAEVNNLDNDLCSPLHRCRTLETARCLKSNGADLEMTNMKEQTAFAQHAMFICSNIIKGQYSGEDDDEFADELDLLDELGGEEVQVVNHLDSENMTVLHHVVLEAAKYTDWIHMMLKFLENLCNFKCDPRVVCSPMFNRTCVHLACVSEGDEMSQPNPRLIWMLIARGGDLNAVDDDGNTPLHLLLRGDPRKQKPGSRVTFPPMLPDRIDCIMRLIKGGASLTIVNNEGISIVQMLSSQNLKVEQAQNEWNKLQEPSASQFLLQKDIFHLPLAVSQGSKNWTDDAKAYTCKACRVQFSLLARKYHCRGCGEIFCSNCLQKDFSFCPSPRSVEATQLPKGTPLKAKVCASCFNSLSYYVETKKKIMTNSSSLFGGTNTGSSAAGSSEVDTRNLLFGDAAARSKALSPPESKTGTTEKKVGALSETLNETRNLLAERGQKINDIADKTSKLENNAANFASAATKLRQQAEKQNKWFPF